MIAIKNLKSELCHYHCDSVKEMACIVIAPIKNSIADNWKTYNFKLFIFLLSSLNCHFSLSSLFFVSTSSLFLFIAKYFLLDNVSLAFIVYLILLH